MDNEAFSGHAQTSNGEHIVIVQDDNTFLLNKQVQFLSNVENVSKSYGAIQQCAVFDVTQAKEFYVDTSEMVSELILPGERTQNVYEHNILLQPMQTVTPEQAQQNVLSLKLEGTHMEMDESQNVTSSKQVQITNLIDDAKNKEPNKPQLGHAEVTISDEQYNLLRQKGWVLLEINDKVFLLDSFGLHDVTSDPRLVEKLRQELKPSLDSNTCKEIIPETTPREDKTPLASQDEELIHCNVILRDNLQNEQNTESVREAQPKDNLYDVSTKEDSNDSRVDVKSILDEEKLRSCRVVKVKTDYKFKDFPNKIILGRNKNGKRIVARVRKRVKNVNNENCEQKEKEDESKAQKSLSEIQTLLVDLLAAHIDDDQVNCTSEHLRNVENIVKEVVKIDAFKDCVTQRRLLVTKVTKREDAFGLIVEEITHSMVPGRLVPNQDSHSFEFQPKLLHELKLSKDRIRSRLLDCDGEQGVKVVHVHIVETRRGNAVARTDVTLHKLRLPVQMAKVQRTYACGVCAQLFYTQEEIKEHQETQCIEVLESDNALTIDTDKDRDTQVLTIITKTSNGYSCGQCQATLKTFQSCLKHQLTHQALDKNSEKLQSEALTCSICNVSFRHKSSLSKHIVNHHLKDKIKF